MGLATVQSWNSTDERETARSGPIACPREGRGGKTDAGPVEDLPHAGLRSGVGLGLSICRGIEELHGGRIWAENRDGGAVFRFTLPLERRAPVVRIDERPPAESAPSIS
jgi:hypothetical protein